MHIAVMASVLLIDMGKILNAKGWKRAMSADGIQRKETVMSTGKVLTLASMVALFLAVASFAGQPASVASEKFNYARGGDLGVDYTAEFAAASVAGQPASVASAKFASEKFNYVRDGDLGVDYTAEFAAASVAGQPASSR
jgi:hypothetical protein